LSALQIFSAHFRKMLLDCEPIWFIKSLLH
jgi:hypothetical protein